MKVVSFFFFYLRLVCWLSLFFGVRMAWCEEMLPAK